MAMGYVDVEGVKLTYGGGSGGTLAVDGLTMSVAQGEFAAVVGPSGCGKSTLMKLTTGLVRPQAGRVTVAGKSVSGPVSIAGMAFQNPSLLPWRTTLRNVMLPLEIVQPHRGKLGRERTAYTARAESLLTLVGLKGFGSKYPWQLSGGMQQRSNLCRALIHDPVLLMLDEPFGALDAFTREELWQVMRDLHAEKKMTVILVTHDLREGRLPCRPHLRHERAARPDHCRAQDRLSAPTADRRHLHGRVQRRRARSARADRSSPERRMSIDLATPRRGIDWIALAPWIYALALFAIWEGCCRAFAIAPFILPAPSKIAEATVQFWTAIWTNSLQTLWTTLLGFALAIAGGLALGILVGWSKSIYAGLYPLMIGFNAVPKVAVIPVLIMWFGIGSVPAVLTAFLIAFFPIVVNVATGLATIEPEMEDVLRALGASKMDIMLKVGIPRALPYFFGSLKVAVTLAFIGSVMSETLGANSGLGHTMLAAQSQFNMPLVFAVLIALAVQGIVMYALMAWVEMRMTGWAHRSSGSQV